MKIKHTPEDLGLWLGYIDLNLLRDDEVDMVPNVDLNSESDLRSLFNIWIKPKYLNTSENVRAEMREILIQSKAWKRRDIEAVFSGVVFPNDQDVKDVEDFMTALINEVDLWENLERSN